MQFTIPGIPIPQPRQRVAVRFGHATTYTPAKHPVNAFKATARLAAADARVVSYNGPVAIRAEFVLPKPASRTKKRDAWVLSPVATKPDLDNLIKSLLDALTGLCWHDDAQVARMEVLKRYVVTDKTGAAIEAARTIVQIDDLTAAPRREEG